MQEQLEKTIKKKKKAPKTTRKLRQRNKVKPNLPTKDHIKAESFVKGILGPSDEEMSEHASDQEESKHEISELSFKDVVVRQPIALRTRSCNKYGPRRKPNTKSKRSSVKSRRKSQVKKPKDSVKKEEVTVNQDSKVKMEKEESKVYDPYQNLLDVSRADSFLKDVKEEEEQRNEKDQKLERIPMLLVSPRNVSELRSSEKDAEANNHPLSTGISKKNKLLSHFYHYALK